MDVNKKTRKDQDKTVIYPIDLDILNFLRDSKAFCDVTIVIESQEFPAHKVILSSSSPYFYTMFLSDFGERDKSRVELKGLDASSFEVIIKFIYTGELEISIENAQSLIMAASLLQMDSLMERCSDFLETQLDVDNCLEIKDFANYQVGCEKLRLAAERFAGKAFDKFFESPDTGFGGTPTKEFLNLTLDDLSNWVSQDNLYVHEDQVLEGVLAWIDHDREIRGGCFEMLMDHIRTKYMSDLCFKKLEMSGHKMDQMPNTDKLARSGHDEMLLARIATSEQKMRPSLYSFDFKEEEWNHVLDPLMPEWLTGNLCSVSNRIYILPDTQERPIKSFGLKTKTFKHSTRPGVNVEVFAVSSAIEVENFVYVITDEKSFKVEINDDGKGNLNSTWKLISPMGDGEKLDFALGELNKKIYVCGGNSAGRNLDIVQMFNVDEDTWSRVASMTSARSGHGVVSLGGYLYVTGGANYDGGHTIFKSVEKYDPETDTWTLVADMNHARFGHGVVSHAGKIYVFGGYREELKFVHGIHDSMEVYDPVSDEWTLLETKMPGTLSGLGLGATTIIHKYNL